ncbi:unnamed protein product [Amoebophrya sp. A120]|nr:unnamed protein product [Amoebophrya sp. A120]|eukprot:GSA120T00022713001.1
MLLPEFKAFGFGSSLFFVLHPFGSVSASFLCGPSAGKEDLTGEDLREAVRRKAFSLVRERTRPACDRSICTTVADYDPFPLLSQGSRGHLQLFEDSRKNAFSKTVVRTTTGKFRGWREARAQNHQPLALWEQEILYDSMPIAYSDSELARRIREKKPATLQELVETIDEHGRTDFVPYSEPFASLVVPKPQLLARLLLRTDSDWSSSHRVKLLEELIQTPFLFHVLALFDPYRKKGDSTTLVPQKGIQIPLDRTALLLNSDVDKITAILSLFLAQNQVCTLLNCKGFGRQQFPVQRLVSKSHELPASAAFARALELTEQLFARWLPRSSAKFRVEFGISLAMYMHGENFSKFHYREEKKLRKALFSQPRVGTMEDQNALGRYSKDLTDTLNKRTRVDEEWLRAAQTLRGVAGFCLQQVRDQNTFDELLGVSSILDAQEEKIAEVVTEYVFSKTSSSHKDAAGGFVLLDGKLVATAPWRVVENLDYDFGKSEKKAATYFRGLERRLRDVIIFLVVPDSANNGDSNDAERRNRKIWGEHFLSTKQLAVFLPSLLHEFQRKIVFRANLPTFLPVPVDGPNNDRRQQEAGARISEGKDAGIHVHQERDFEARLWTWLIFFQTDKLLAAAHLRLGGAGDTTELAFRGRDRNTFVGGFEEVMKEQIDPASSAGHETVAPLLQRVLQNKLAIRELLVFRAHLAIAAVRTFSYAQVEKSFAESATMLPHAAPGNEKMVFSWQNLFFADLRLEVDTILQLFQEKKQVKSLYDELVRPLAKDPVWPNLVQVLAVEREGLTDGEEDPMEVENELSALQRMALFLALY